MCIQEMDYAPFSLFSLCLGIHPEVQGIGHSKEGGLTALSTRSLELQSIDGRWRGSHQLLNGGLAPHPSSAGPPRHKQALLASVDAPSVPSG
jgi:hypothetical protein